MKLTSLERGVLEQMAGDPGAVFSRDALLRAVDQTISRLRRKIESAPKRPAHLLSIYGEGYPLAGDGEPGKMLCRQARQAMGAARIGRALVDWMDASGAAARRV